MKRTFFAIVTEQDLPKDRTPSREGNDPSGPLMMETYLNPEHTTRESVEQIAARMRFDRYGWVRIAEVTVDIPDEPAAMPAAAAGMHA